MCSFCISISLQYKSDKNMFAFITCSRGGTLYVLLWRVVPKIILLKHTSRKSFLWFFDKNDVKNKNKNKRKPNKRTNNNLHEN